MKKFTKVALITGVVALASGILITAIGFGINGFDGFSIVWNDGFKFTDEELVTMEKTSFDEFRDVEIDVVGKITFVENNTSEYAIEYALYGSDETVKCDVDDGKLIVKTKDTVSILNFGGLSVDEDGPYVTIYYPRGAEFNSIFLDTSAGGFISKDNFKCKNLSVDCSAGGIKLANFEGEIDVDCSAGGMIADNCNFTDLVIDLAAGGITLSDSTINGGDIDVSAGGVEATGITLLKDITIDCSAGGVNIELVDGDDIGFDIDSSVGSIKIDDDKYSGELEKDIDADVVVKIDCSAGSVEINHK